MNQARPLDHPRYRYLKLLEFLLTDGVEVEHMLGRSVADQLGRREESDNGLSEDLVHSSLGEKGEVDPVKVLLEEGGLDESSFDQLDV